MGHHVGRPVGGMAERRGTFAFPGVEDVRVRLGLGGMLGDRQQAELREGGTQTAMP
jgi:hypothetical protein